MQAPINSTQPIEKSAKPPYYTLSVAPMMDWTDRHYRYFARLITRHTLLYTEMINVNALTKGKDVHRFLDFNASEHPVALQLGGSDPKLLAQCSRMVEEWGYDEVNLNVGCPSEKVSKGRFGACLMAEPDLVAACLAEMRAAVRHIPVTVKHRIGIDDLDSYDHLCNFISTVAKSGVTDFIIHARKAWLSGLSPKQNREVPPLRHDVVHRIKGDFPHLRIMLNGGIQSVADAAQHLAPIPAGAIASPPAESRLDGVMIGRAAYETPYILAHADPVLYGDARPVRSAHQVIDDLIPYAEKQTQNGVPLHHISRHILGLFQGQPGARAFRRTISERAPRANASDTAEILRAAAAHVPVQDENEAPNTSP
jgi:tRNA-dihydrouridine synthase A